MTSRPAGCRLRHLGGSCRYRLDVQRVGLGAAQHGEGPAAGAVNTAALPDHPSNQPRPIGTDAGDIVTTSSER